jgi:ABC transporter substrate binding protein (PQQ-dependent alcohol dehydrogenase system)
MYAAAAAKARESRIVLWTSSLEKYGASQLNDRFHARFGYPMDSPAWAGWFAVKIVWESMLRATGADRLRDTLASTKTQFDGHKGAPLSFRAWDHQLRQPLYATGSGADGRPREIPDITASVPVRDLLDTIGDVAGRNACRQP